MRHFTASDGVSIAFEDVGHGRPLVLLHGLMAHRGFFHRQSELSREFRLVSVDLRGHGDSRSMSGLTLERLARDVEEIAASLDLRDAIGIGWSLGASILWHVLNGAEAGRFAGAVVVDMTPRVLNADGWALGLSPETCESRSRAIAEDFTSFATNAGHAIFAEPAGASRSDAEWAGREFARNEGPMIDALWRSLVEQDYRDLLSGIRQPTLIVHGAQSHLYGSDTADYLATALPEAEIVQFDHSGHSPQIEQPELFNDAIRSFAARLSHAQRHEITA